MEKSGKNFSLAANKISFRRGRSVNDRGLAVIKRPRSRAGVKCHCSARSVVLFYGSRTNLQLANNAMLDFPRKRNLSLHTWPGSNGRIKARTLFTTPHGHAASQGMHKPQVKDRCSRERWKSVSVPVLLHCSSRSLSRKKRTDNNKLIYRIKIKILKRKIKI